MRDGLGSGEIWFANGWKFGEFVLKNRIPRFGGGFYHPEWVMTAHPTSINLSMTNHFKFDPADISCTSGGSTFSKDDGRRR